MKKLVLLTTGMTALFFAFVLTASYSPAQEKESRSMVLGRKLFADPSVGANGKSCASCHKEDVIGDLAGRGEWFHGKAKTLEQAINLCIEGALGGKALPENSVKMKALSGYMKAQIKK